MEHFYIITNKPKDEQLQITDEVVSFLEEKGKRCTLCVRDKSAEEYRKNTLKARQEIQVPKDVDCILVLGGDGTLLQAAGDTMDLDIPLLGINLGSLGFMAEVEKGNLKQALTALINGDYHVEERMMLDGQLFHEGEKVKEFHALNDIVLTRTGSLKIVSYDIYVNGQFLNSYHADGVIVSTPTGSTGYNMSAGGPLVEPQAKLLLLTPICPHTIGARSIVLSPEDVIEIKVQSSHNGEEQEMEVNFDGSLTRQMCQGDSIKICRSKRVTKFIRLSKVSFLEVLHKKLSE
ncbi:MAG: NAD(+)/NADH kinase [Lachnospiraceae bacterium]|nr:NAD(+)/NADH kinase [Lachnospiraceae bacterium]